MSFKYFVLCVFVVCLAEITASYRRNSHSHSKWRTRYKDTLEKELVEMPTGTFKWITTPKLSKYKEKHFKCGSKGNNSVVINLKPDGKMSRREYEIVKSQIDATMTGTVNIVSIQKIINPCLWKKYQFAKKEISVETRKLNEMLLFHGSAKAMEIINTGFDERYANLNGLLGAGLYFSSHFAKSNMYTRPQSDGNKLMLLCRVVLGKIHEAPSTYHFPHAPHGHNSVKGTPLNFPEFVVYRGEQIYPEFLIKYT